MLRCLPSTRHFSKTLKDPISGICDIVGLFKARSAYQTYMDVALGRWQHYWSFETFKVEDIFRSDNGQKKSKREKTRECHNHKPQPFPDPKRKRKPTNPNKHKSNKRTKSTKISSLFPKRGNRNTKRTEKQKNKMTHGKTYNKSPRRMNHKATKSKTNTGTTALERSVE